MDEVNLPVAFQLSRCSIVSLFAAACLVRNTQPSHNKATVTAFEDILSFPSFALTCSFSFFIQYFLAVHASLCGKGKRF